MGHIKTSTNRIDWTFTDAGGVADPKSKTLKLAISRQKKPHPTVIYVRGKLSWYDIIQGVYRTMTGTTAIILCDIDNSLSPRPGS